MSEQPETGTEAGPTAARPPKLDPRLIGLNIVLLAVLAAASFGVGSDRQAGPGGGPAPNQAARGRGEYTLISGRVQGSSTHAVYLLDSSNHELVALGWDRNRARLEPIGFRNLAEDAMLFQGNR